MCAGLAAHLGVSVGVVRLVMAFLGLAGGAGVALYVFWWLAIPAGDPADAAQEVRPSALTRLARRQAIIEPGRRIPVTDIAIGGVLVVAAAGGKRTPAAPGVPSTDAGIEVPVGGGGRDAKGGIVQDNRHGGVNIR